MARRHNSFTQRFVTRRRCRSSIRFGVPHFRLIIKSKRRRKRQTDERTADGPCKSGGTIRKDKIVFLYRKLLRVNDPSL